MAALPAQGDVNAWGWLMLPPHGSSPGVQQGVKHISGLQGCAQGTAAQQGCLQSQKFWGQRAASTLSPSTGHSKGKRMARCSPSCFSPLERKQNPNYSLHNLNFFTIAPKTEPKSHGEPGPAPTSCSKRCPWVASPQPPTTGR